MGPSKNGMDDEKSGDPQSETASETVTESNDTNTTESTPKPQSPPNEPTPEPEPMEWSCGVCTFVNPAHKGVCEMCGTPNPNAPPSAFGGGFGAFGGGMGGFGG